MTYWLSPWGPLRDQIFDEAGAGHDGGTEGARELRVHVTAAAPVHIRGKQLQADLVIEHMRRRIDRDMERAPQRDPRAVLSGAASLALMSIVAHDGHVLVSSEQVEEVCAHSPQSRMPSIALEIIRRFQLVLDALFFELLLGLVPELRHSAVGLARFFPKLKGTRADIIVVELSHSALSPPRSRPCKPGSREGACNSIRRGLAAQSGTLGDEPSG